MLFELQLVEAAEIIRVELSWKKWFQPKNNWVDETLNLGKERTYNRKLNRWDLDPFRSILISIKSGGDRSR